MIKTEKRLNFVKQRFGAPIQNKAASSPNMVKDDPNISQSIEESNILPTSSNDYVTNVEGKKLEFTYQMCFTKCIIFFKHEKIQST